MAHVLNDRVKETTTSTGTGTINLAGAEVGFESFVAGIGNSNTTYYCIVHQSADEFEVGIGTVTDASPDTLSRTTIISSSNSDSAVDFSAGTKDVFCTLPASKTVFFDESSGSSDVAIGSRGTNPMGLSITGTVLALTEQTNVASFQMDGNQASRIDMGSGPGTRQFIIYTDTSNYSELKRTDAKPILFGTDNTERLRILQGGGVQLAAGNDISNASGDLTLDVVGGIILDADDNGTVSYKDAGTRYGYIEKSSNDMIIQSTISDGDIKFNGNDGGSTITALTLDMSAAGSAYFNNMVGIGTTDPDTDGYSYAEDLVIKAGASADDGAGLSIQSNTRRYGVIAFGDSANDNEGEIWYDHTANSFNMRTANVQRFSLDSSGNAIFTGNVTAFGSVSDERLKENIEVIDNPIDKVKQLKGVTFNYKKDGQKSTGLIAQDLEKVLPEAVYTSETIADRREGEESKEHLAIHYGNTVGLLVEAIKELEARVKELEDK